MPVVEAGAGPGILEVYKAESLQSNAEARLIDALRNHPSVVAEALRCLHRDRTPLRAGEYDDDFSRLVAVLCHVYKRIDEGDKQAWAGIFQSSLLEVYMDIIAHDAFFFESQNLIDNIFESLYCIVAWVPEAAEHINADAIFARGSERLWKILWENRHLIRIPYTDADPSTEALERGAWGTIITLHMAYGSLALDLEIENSNFPSYLPHMGIYLFTRSNPVFPTQHRLLAPFIMAGEASLGRPNKIIRVFHESFPQNGSSSVFFDRLNWYMSRTGRSPFDPQNPLGITELGNCARLLKIIASIPAMAPVIEHHQCLRVALLAVQNHRHAMPRLVYENLAVLFDVLTHAFLHLTNITNPVTIRGEDVIPFLACGLELIVNGHIPVHIYTIVRENIDEYTKAAKSLAKSTSVQPRHHELFQGLQAGAKMEWWPTLRLVQQASPQTSSANQSQIQKLTEKWVAFGTALGLDAAKERQRHEREMRKHCSWRACQYHKEELPETKLKACAGCGETRYCGRDCQKSDWTKGAHKQRCRRLK